jgi:hypothetical protein
MYSPPWRIIRPHSGVGYTDRQAKKHDFLPLLTVQLHGAEALSPALAAWRMTKLPNSSDHVIGSCMQKALTNTRLNWSSKV